MLNILYNRIKSKFAEGGVFDIEAVKSVFNETIKKLSVVSIVVFAFILQITLSSDETLVPIANNILEQIFYNSDNVILLSALVNNALAVFAGILLAGLSWRVFMSVLKNEEPYKIDDFLYDLLGNSQVYPNVKKVIVVLLSLSYLFSVISKFWTETNTFLKFGECAWFLLRQAVQLSIFLLVIVIIIVIIRRRKWS